MTLHAEIKIPNAAGGYNRESVECKESVLPWQAAGLSWTATGYSEKKASRYMVRWNGRWRRVYSFNISNGATYFVGKNLESGFVVELWES